MKKKLRNGTCNFEPGLDIEPCQCVSDQSWACHGPLQGQMQALQCAAGVVGPGLGAAAGLGRWFVGGAVLLNAGVFFQMWRCRSATTAHRALPVCEWPALGMPWATARPNTACAVCGRFGGACTGCCGRAVQVGCGGYRFTECWSFPDVEAPLGNHSAQSPASV